MKNNIDFTFDPDRSIDVICMGRVAVDLYAEQIHCPLAEASTFKKYLGGCAGNIAVGTSRLGLTSVMFSCVGQDEMGKFLKGTLESERVGTQLLYESARHLTGLVLLGVMPPAHFPLMFYRNNCADMQLRPEHVKHDVIKDAKALLVTGTGLSTAAMQKATLFAVMAAESCRTRVIIDLDFRPVLWGLTPVGDGETRYLADSTVTSEYQKILPHCDLIVGTEEEICIASGAENLTDGMAILRKITNAPIVVKAGEKGCEVYLANEKSPRASRPFPVEILNVLGAGDAFMSGLLRGLLRGESWEKATTWANASGAIVVTRHGCAPAIPYFNELEYFVAHYDGDPQVWKSHAFLQMHNENERSNPYPENRRLLRSPLGFEDGLTPIVKMHAKTQKDGMNFSCLKLRQGEQRELTSSLEAAFLLMTGRVIFYYENQTRKVERAGYFEQDPIVLHCPAYTSAHVVALTDCEILVIETKNDHHFAPMLFDQHNLLESDHRGKDILDDTSYRIVRTVFDKRNRPKSNLVLGEIITFQGRWSSYPPHYHAQAEIYHYRFSEPQGFAFGENGDEVLRIRHYDTYQIADNHEHAHCTAPGYALYTLWFIRHLPGNPYTIPTFRPEHEWTRRSVASRRVWKPMAVK